MLAWPAGPRPSDGVWAPHWYARVRASTGFESPRPAGTPSTLRGAPAEVAAACLPHYERLYASRLVPGATG